MASPQLLLWNPVSMQQDNSARNALDAIRLFGDSIKEAGDAGIELSKLGMEKTKDAKQIYDWQKLLNQDQVALATEAWFNDPNNKKLYDEAMARASKNAAALFEERQKARATWGLSPAQFALLNEDFGSALKTNQEDEKNKSENWLRLNQAESEAATAAGTRQATQENIYNFQRKLLEDSARQHFNSMPPEWKARFFDAAANPDKTEFDAMLREIDSSGIVTPETINSWKSGLEGTLGSIDSALKQNERYQKELRKLRQNEKAVTESRERTPFAKGLGLTIKDTFDGGLSKVEGLSSTDAAKANEALLSSGQVQEVLSELAAELQAKDGSAIDPRTSKFIAFAVSRAQSYAGHEKLSTFWKPGQEMISKDIKLNKKELLNILRNINAAYSTQTSDLELLGENGLYQRALDVATTTLAPENVAPYYNPMRGFSAFNPEEMIRAALNENIRPGDFGIPDSSARNLMPQFMNAWNSGRPWLPSYTDIAPSSMRKQPRTPEEKYQETLDAVKNKELTYDSALEFGRTAPVSFKQLSEQEETEERKAVFAKAEKQLKKETLEEFNKALKTDPVKAANILLSSPFLSLEDKTQEKIIADIKDSDFYGGDITFTQQAVPAKKALLKALKDKRNRIAKDSTSEEALRLDRLIAYFEQNTK